MDEISDFPLVSKNNSPCVNIYSKRGESTHTCALMWIFLHNNSRKKKKSNTEQNDVCVLGLEGISLQHLEP